MVLSISIKYKRFSKKFIGLRDRTLRGTTPGNNDNKGVTPEVKPHHRIQVAVITKTLFL